MVLATDRLFLKNGDFRVFVSRRDRRIWIQTLAKNREISAYAQTPFLFCCR
jgi:hypothetical protein